MYLTLLLLLLLIILFHRIKFPIALFWERWRDFNINPYKDPNDLEFKPPVGGNLPNSTMPERESSPSTC